MWLGWSGLCGLPSHPVDRKNRRRRNGLYIVGTASDGSSRYRHFRNWPLNIKTTVVLGQSFSKVSVINVHSRAPCPSLPLCQFCWVCSFYGMIGCRQVIWTFQVSIVAYYYQSAKCTRWDVTSSNKAWNVGYISVYSNLSSYASGSTKTCMEKVRLDFITAPFSSIKWGVSYC